MGNIIIALAAVVAPLIAGWIIKEVTLGVAFINALPGPIPAIIAIVVSSAVGALDKLIPALNLPGDLSSWTQAGVSGALMAIVAILTHTSAANKVARLERGLKK